MAEIKIQQLQVDLTTGTSKVVDVTSDVKTYFGGSGLGLKQLWDMNPKGIDALSPDAILGIGVGPVTGLIGSKISMFFKSPLDNWSGEASVSGEVGWELVSAQYNAGILIKGKAPKPSYLFVYDDKVEVRDATDLWGKWRQETNAILEDRLYKETGHVFPTLVIGPAGEKLARIANVTTQFIHSASKKGVGAVFGSKNIKAIAVKGTKGPLYADHKAVYDLWMAYATSPVTALHRTGESRWGHSRSLVGGIRHMMDPTKNQHGTYADGSALIGETTSFHLHDLRHHIWEMGCPGCAAACFTPYLRRDARGIWAGEYRHGNSTGYGVNWMCDGDTLSETSSLIDELGVDGEEIGCLVGWAIDLYAKGIITKADCDGIEPKYGDIESCNELVKKICFRQGKVGNAMAEGFRSAEAVFGPNSVWDAWETQGMACPRYDVRHKTYGSPTKGLACGSGGGINDSVTFCSFALTPFSTLMGGNNAVAQKFLNAACGWNLTVDDVAKIIRRSALLGRCYALREGFDINKDYSLPPRAFDEELLDKYGNKWIWKKEDWDAYKVKQFTTSMGLDDKGRPKESELTALGLDFVLPVLKPMGVIG